MTGERQSVPNIRRSSAVGIHLVRLAWPMIVTQAAVALMQFTDAWMVSGQGLSALAAITPATLMVLVATTLGTGYLTSVNTCVGQAFGAGKHRLCGAIAWQGIWAALAGGILLLSLIPTAPVLFGFFGHSPEVQALEVSYYQVAMLAVLPQLLANAIANYFLGTHQPRFAMAGTIIAVALNTLLNYLLIFGKFGFPALGFVGAAWGTVFASVAYALFMMACFYWSRKARGFATRKPCWRPKLGRKLARLGLPAGVQDAVELVAWGVLLIALIGTFGEAHLAAASVLVRCMQLSFLPADGLGSALLATVAKSIGSQRFRDATHEARLAFRMTATYMTTMAVLFFVFREPIMRLFSSDPEVIRIGSRAMVCVCLFQLFDAMSITYVHALQGAGDSAWPSLVNAVLCLVILLGGGLAVIFFAPQLNSFGIWLAATAYIMALGLSLWYRWAKGPWRLIELFENEHSLS